MSRTPGKSSDDATSPPSVTVEDEASSASLPVDIDLGRDPTEADDALWAADAQAAADSGDLARADALLCARALLAERRADDAAAAALWRGAFDREPRLLVAFWGLRRQLLRAHAWRDLQSVLEARIAAITTVDRAKARADLWLERGRIFEDHLQQDDDAAQSYRAGLLEVPDHAGLLTSLCLLGARREDPAATADALSGFLRLPLPARLRAVLSALLARIERLAKLPSAGGPSSATLALGPASAARAFETLRRAWKALGDDPSTEVDGPLIEELSALAQVTAEPSLRADMLAELVSHLPAPRAEGALGLASGGGASTDDSAEGDPRQALAVALLRERARVLRDDLSDTAGAVRALRDALARAPRHPGLAMELADAIAMVNGENEAGAAADLHDLMAVAAPLDRAFETEAQQELALRYLTALARADRFAEALAIFENHAELPRNRPDVMMLELLFRAVTGDVAGLATRFEQAGTSWAQTDGQRDIAAHAFTVAATLLERSGGTSRAERLYRRAHELAPGLRPAGDALERRLWSTASWPELAALLRSNLERIDPTRADRSPNRRPGASQSALTAEAARAAERYLEDLVAVYRDHLDDPAGASWAQDWLTELAAQRPGEDVPANEARATQARAWARRYDLELGAAVHGSPTEAAERVRVLEELAARAGVPAIQSALRVEAGRVALSGDDPQKATTLLQQALVGDGSAMASAGLEQLSAGDDPESAATRMLIVRQEIGRLVMSQPDGTARADRLRALRFRVAWHALSAHRPDEALEALAPLRSTGDDLARAWSWEIARRSDQPGLMLLVLRDGPAAPDEAGLVLPTDRAEVLEWAGERVAAASSYRDAQRGVAATDAALGLLRVGAASGDANTVLEAIRALADGAEAGIAPLLSREVAMLSLLYGQGDTPAVSDVATFMEDDPLPVVLRWAAGIRDPNPLGAAAGLLAVARLVPEAGPTEEIDDRNTLLARAATRARLGGPSLAGAVHDQVMAVSNGAVPVGVGLADLPVAGRSDRLAARVARAERNGGQLAYALDLECALDAEARGDTSSALEGFARALGRDAEGIEALDGIKRVALAIGDRLGAARAGMRLGAVLRVPARAGAEFAVAGQLYEDLGHLAEAASAYWQALAREPGSVWLYERLRHLLQRREDAPGLDRLFSHGLAAAVAPAARLALLHERGEHRLGRLDDRKGAIEDFKRMLKIDPHHPLALRHLATLAVRMEHFPQAVRFLDRLLAREADEERAAALRLELAEAYEAAREPARAVETLKRAATARPRDVAPWQRLVDLLLRLGDWPGALATLRSWDAVLADATAKAEIWIRIGCLLRDHARDPNGAAHAFATASELDPLGDGIRALAVLHGDANRGDARQAALRRAIGGMRRLLERDPLDVPRLRRLREMFEWASAGARPADADPRSAPPIDGRAGALVAGQLLGLAGEDVALFPLGRLQLRAPLPSESWNHLRVAAAGGFAAELWPLLAGAASELFPAPRSRSSQRERLGRGAEPRLEWIEGTASALGVSNLEMWMVRGDDRRGGERVSPETSDASEQSALPFGEDDAALLLGRGVFTGSAATRFNVGRAVALLRQRAGALERIDARDLQALFAAAAVVAGAPPPAAGRVGVPAPEERARALGKAMSRKDRKALEMLATRFATESIDATAFRAAVLATADRVGLLLAGDLAVAIRVLLGGAGQPVRGAVTPAAVATHARAMDLIRFSLSDDHFALRRELGMGTTEMGDS